MAACEGKETCILTRHLLRDDGDRVERGERRRATASDVVSIANSLTSAHRRESRATRTARPVEWVMRALGARSATADRPTDLVVGDVKRAPPPPPLLEEHTNHTGRAGWEASAGIPAPFVGLLFCQKTPPWLRSRRPGCFASCGVVFCCCGCLLVLVVNTPCTSPALALR